MLAWIFFQVGQAWWEVFYLHGSKGMKTLTLYTLPWESNEKGPELLLSTSPLVLLGNLRQPDIHQQYISPKFGCFFQAPLKLKFSMWEGNHYCNCNKLFFMLCLCYIHLGVIWIVMRRSGGMPDERTH